jgi:Ni,Fe-hydrogenase III small subunit/formate hydrogenlyase subunit 6/NADH:ubiquinone oxidoreductase subunit I
MIKALSARIRQGYRTAPFPNKEMKMPERYLGLPAIDGSKCVSECRKCLGSCPVSCINKTETGISIDLGICIFCGNCTKECPTGAITFSKNYSMATRKREDLVIGGDSYKHAEELDKEMKSLFGRSLKLRVVSAGGCNACESDTNVLNTLVWDLGRFGIQFVASPRHADGLLVIGTVTPNMILALKKTYDAVAYPKIVITVGACAISGGIYGGVPDENSGADSIVPVDLHIPGCPPHPATILDGLLRLLGRIR